VTEFVSTVPPESGPRKRGRGSGRWLDVATSCRERPGEWAVVRGVTAAMMRRITSGGYGTFQPPEAWEIEQRLGESASNGARQYDLYIRFRKGTYA
jgi:hypothetical protein